MSFTETKRSEIKKYILRKIDDDDEEMIAKTVDAFGISTTSVKRYIESELLEGHIARNESALCGYMLISSEKKLSYDISQISEREDGIVYQDILPLINVNERAERIWRYTLCEIFNNAIEHSEGDKVDVYILTNCLYTQITLVDNGVGIFRKVYEGLERFGYRDPILEDAVTELYKGKFTTCPDRHTGEGIFFSRCLLDKISIVSDGMVFRSGYVDKSSFIKSHLLHYAMKLMDKGTVVTMQIENDTRRDPANVFDEYSSIEDGFIRTRIPVLEACLDRDPVARSQARRLCSRLDSFNEVTLDFEGVEMMGQGFADEIFRVFQNSHPDVTLTPVGMNSFVHKMYLHAVNTKVTAPDFSGN